MSNLVRIALMSLASLMALYSAITLFRVRHEKSDMTGLRVFFLEPLYPAGHRFRKRIHRQNRTARDRYRKLLELYTPGEAECMQQHASDAAHTYLLLLSPVVFMLLAVTGDVLLFTLELLLLIGIYFYFDYWLSSTVRKRHAELMNQYPTMLTEMSLMVNVGITAGEAFQRVAVSSDGLLFREMQRVTESVKNGMPIDEALETLCTRVPLREMKKFVSLYQQNLTKGGPDFPHTLTEMAENAWNDRKTAARTSGELAEQKLLIPTMLMFVGILFMIIVPAFRNLF